MTGEKGTVPAIRETVPPPKSHAIWAIRGTFVITRNGDAKVVLQDIESYEQTQETRRRKRIHSSWRWRFRQQEMAEPSNVLNAAKAGPGGAVALDAFSPPREEYR